ncbi:MAG: hypothetical protein QOD00_1418 [Blastocatellia bacterium]|jgi:hypothetical protein|nr:hypothetical protein [Blastocatellia bacterium]
MRKTLFVLTRDYGEYDENWWGFDNQQRITSLDFDQDRKAVFIRQDDRPFHAYSNTIAKELQGDLPDEIGIIIHKHGNDEVAAGIRNGLPDKVKERVKFCTWYGTGLEGFWDRTDENKELPYNAFKLAVHNNLYQGAAFERVWGFFIFRNDAVLEAKIKIIQNILNDEAPDRETLKVLRENVAGFDRLFGDFVQALMPGAVENGGEASDFYKRFEEFTQLSGDIFSTEYQTAYEKLRDALGVE